MRLFPELRSRNTTDREELERVDADPERVQRTIAQFRLINRLFSGSHRLLRERFFPIMEQDPGRTYSLLEVGAGGCDVAIRVVEEARRRGLKLTVTALDNDPRVLAVARQAIEHYPEIRIVEGSALDPGLLEPFDFAFSNHFLHHLSWNELQFFLERLLPRTRIAFLMNDLKRSGPALLGFTIFAGLLLRGSFHFQDGRLSIQRGFLPEELRTFLRGHYPDVPIQVLETRPARVVLWYRADERQGTERDSGQS